MGRSRGSFLVVAGLSLGLAACHAITGETPTEPTKSTPAPPARTTRPAPS